MANIILGNMELSTPANIKSPALTGNSYASILATLHKNQPNTITVFFANEPEHIPSINSPINYVKEIAVQTNTVPIEFKFEKNVIAALRENIKALHNTPVFKAIQLQVTAACCRCMDAILIKGNKAIRKTYTFKEVKAELKLKAPFKGVEMQLNQEFSDGIPLQAKKAIITILKKAIAADKDFDTSILSSYNKNLLPSLLQTDRDHIQKVEDLLGEMCDISISVLERYLHGAKADFTSIITEEILRQLYPEKCGITILDEVKKRAEPFWQTDRKNSKNDKQGGDFLRQLEDFGTKHGQISINVVCHSVGAITGCEFIKAVTRLRSDVIKIENIILLAPACTFKLFEDSIMKVRSLHDRFRMFTMRDQYEQMDVFVEGVYTQSPLYLISGLLEDKYYPGAPILGLERIRRAPSINHANITTSVHSFLEGYGHSGKVVYSVTNKRDIPTGHECTATHHEDFLQDPATIASIIEIINNGMKPPPLAAFADGNGPINDSTSGLNFGASGDKGTSPGAGSSRPPASSSKRDNYLEITVTKWKGECDKLKFSAKYRISQQESTIINFKTVHLLTDIQAYYYSSILDLGKSPDSDSYKEEYMQRMGMHYYEELFPLGLRKLIWKLKNKVSTLIIIDSFDDVIAWEFCKMWGKDTNGIVQNAPFLCESFNLVRYSFNELKDTLSLENTAIITPKSNLPYAQVEKGILFQLAEKHSQMNATDIKATISEVTAMFKSGKYNAIIFIGHGKSHEQANKSGIKLEDGEITPEYLSGDTSNLGQASPFVFLNSCYSGKTGPGLTAVGGWARAFLRAGASCFIGSTFAINDAQATKFAAHFYQYLFENYTVAEAARYARLAIKKTGDPSWLYYVVYAHPFAKLQGGS
ncbi:CHAT domain-containing protein [Chitinophaga filiformis]|uniref:CHAT domain-containing protein n=1 Tax=Chitinophaga filiformis TaxID=104663 RepID=A0A1G7HL36_CHIFI|nr:CHAT domain-containing protein [Chitinophaga filiformis]SDF00709.1 Alpha/beta hydrolase of unknown function [Chitinophaga filiformis]